MRLQRFNQFKVSLAHELGMKAHLLADQSVLIARTEFSPEKRLRTVQEAIDTFARYMPEELRRAA